MTNILSVSRIPLENPIGQILDIVNDPIVTANFTIVNKSEVEFLLMTVAELSSYNAIVFGLSDGGVDVSPKIADIMAAVDAGVRVLFAHDTFDSAWVKKNRADLVSYLALKGINPEGKSYNMDESNTIESIQIIDSLHPLITAYYDLKTLVAPIPVQWTHNNGAIVDKINAKIIIDCPLRLSASDNSYLAIYEDLVAVHKKIAFCAIGHNEGDWDNFVLPPIDECKIFANILYWLYS